MAVGIPHQAGALKRRFLCPEGRMGAYAESSLGQEAQEVSAEEVTERAKQTLKIVREMLERAKESTHKALEKATPAVQKSIDSSLEAAAKGFNGTLQTIDGATVDDQVKLLKAYRRFLGGQVEYVENRIRALEERVESKKG